MSGPPGPLAPSDIDVREAELRRRTAEGPSDGPLVVDVRERGEVVVGRIEGAILLPLSQFVARFRELPPERPLLIVCQSGYRSALAAAFLVANGYRDVANVSGGMVAWQAAGLPVLRGPLADGEGETPPR
jgi:rhodanese-related sulfurtransferase